MAWLAFYKGKGSWVDRLIRWSTKGHVSHVELVAGFNEDGLAYCISASGLDGGVRTKWIRLKLARWDVVKIEDHIKIDIEIMEKNIGKKYDFRGILTSQFLNLRRHNPEKWFCSEICAASLGLPNPASYSPQDLKDILEYLNCLTSKLLLVNSA